MNVLNFTAAVELQASDQAAGVQARILAYTGGVMTVAGFGSVVVDLAGMTLPASVPLLGDHRNALDSLAGSGTPSTNGQELRVEGIVATSSPAGALVLSLSRAGVNLQASIGADVARSTRMTEPFQVNGRTIEANAKNPITLISQSNLKEVSFVAIGADGSTQVTLAAMAAERTKMNEIETAVLAERQRVATIEKLTAGLDSSRVADLKAQAIEGSLPVEDLKTELLGIMRASRPVASNFSRPANGSPEGGKVLEASLCLSCGLDPAFVAKEYGETVVDAAMSRTNRGASLHSAMRACLAAAGEQVPVTRFSDGTVRAAFEASVKLQATSMVSTYSLPGIFANVANKAALSAFSAVATTWQTFCRKSNVPDFKTNYGYRLTANGSFQKIASMGEIKHISLDEQDKTNSIDTYGAMLSIGRRDLINDDLGVLSSVPKVLGRQAAVKLEKAVYEVLLANSGSFFGSGNGNYISGATTNLSSEGLRQGYVEILEQVDPNGDPVMISPKVLLVPPALFAIAREITTSTNIVISGDEELVRGSANIWAGLLTPVSSSYLGVSGGLSGASETAWYLLTGPGDFAVMDVAFLNGVVTPTVETAELNFEVLGVQMRAYHDFGVALLEHRGGLKSKGAA